ncbi:MAG: hypothetical protein OEZ03_04930 [Alphaproteobacteria bacterium]|nr:hypothetical protein [Alphaproteobacteria bacterium]
MKPEGLKRGYGSRWSIALMLLVAAITLMTAPGAYALPNPLDCTKFSEGRLIRHSSRLEVPCYEYHASRNGLFSSLPNEVHLYHPAAWGYNLETAPGSAAEVVKIIALALLEAVPHLNDYAEMPAMDVIVHDRLRSGEAGGAGMLSPPFAVTTSDVRSIINYMAKPPCTVAFYLPSLSAPKELIEHITAHESFHCLHQQEFPKQTTAAPDAWWWIEGGAEYFAHEVFPCNNGEHLRMPLYNPDSPITSHTKRGSSQLYPYPVSAFMYFLATQGNGTGGQGIIDMIGNAPSARGEAGQRSALMSVSGIEKTFHNFGRSFIDQNVYDCRSVLPVEPDYGELKEIGERGDVTVEADPFTIGRVQIKLRRNMIYRIKVETQGADGMLAIRPSDDVKGWTDNFTEIRTPKDCDAEPLYYLIATAVGVADSSFNATLSFEGEENEEDDKPRDMASDKTVESICSGTADRNLRNDCRSCLAVKKKQLAGLVDSCLVGTWELVKGAREFEADMRRQGPEGQHGADIRVETKAPRYLTFLPDGRLAHNASETSLITQKGDGKAVKTQAVGPGVGYWHGREGRMDICVLSDRGPEILTVFAKGKAFSAPPMETNFYDHIRSGKASYTCSPTELRFEKQAVGYRAYWTYRRPGEQCEEK